MKGPARLLLASAVLIAAANTSWGQVNIQPTPAPVVTAENEAWYQSGEAITFAGTLYYPAGPAIHFLPNEMVRSGFYRGVPLYSRTTIEPYSVVFVPVAGGMMQPYERRRDGELAGTKGSAAPAISPALAPSASPTTAASPSPAPSPAMAQAPAPPFVTAPVLGDERVAPPAAPAAAAPSTAANTPSARQPAGTAGRTTTPRRPTRIRPTSSNAIYVEFDNARWFSAGPPVSLDVRTLTRIGESNGFPVYAVRPGDSTIYVPIARGLNTFAPYSKRK